MAAETPDAAPAPESWPVLDVQQRRLLGVLVEKAKTTPDVYPMSVNALMTGANQKSNRDPLLNLSEEDIDETLLELQKKNLVTQVQGGRVVRWRHNLYDQWTSSKVGMAVITELLLRGPQTEGELRGRASRMEPIEDLETLRSLLQPLAERRLVVFLGPEGRRGTLITHGFHAPAELEALRSRAAIGEPETAPPRLVAAPAPSPALQNSLAELKAEIADLRSQLERVAQRSPGTARRIPCLQEIVGRIISGYLQLSIAIVNCMSIDPVISLSGTCQPPTCLRRVRSFLMRRTHTIFVRMSQLCPHDVSRSGTP